MSTLYNMRLTQHHRAVSNKVLDQLPPAFWKSKVSKLIDTAAAGGQLLVVAAERFRQHGHSEKNISGRLFGIVEHPKDIDFCKNYNKVLGTLWSGGLEKLEEFQGSNMNFRIASNPPYNSGIVEKKHDVYTHVAMNSSKEGYIGFMIKSLTNCLGAGCTATFITPGKYLTSCGTSDFRKWLFENWCVDSIEYLPEPDKVFDDAALDSIVITTITNNSNPTRKIHLTPSAGEPHTVDVSKCIDNLVPDLNAELTKIWHRVSTNETFVDHSCGTVGEYGASNKIEFSDTKSPQHLNRVVSGSTETNPDYRFTSLPAHTDDKYYRVAGKKAFASSWCMVDKNVSIDHTMHGVICESKKHARTVHLWMNSKLFNLLWAGIINTRHTHTTLRYMPFVSGCSTSITDIYKNLGLTQKEIKYIESQT